jgi:hypothetical protein
MTTAMTRPGAVPDDCHGLGPKTLRIAALSSPVSAAKTAISVDSVTSRGDGPRCHGHEEATACQVMACSESYVKLSGNVAIEADVDPLRGFLGRRSGSVCSSTSRRRTSTTVWSARPFMFA